MTELKHFYILHLVSKTYRQYVFNSLGTLCRHHVNNVQCCRALFQEAGFPRHGRIQGMAKCWVSETEL